MSDARKMVVQIPCYNEEETLPVTLDALPRTVEGFDEVAWLVIDDGSTDATAEVARQEGVDRVVRLPIHQGLAAAFTEGLATALEMGADVIVNTDADNQYDARDLPRLVRPILEDEAQMVIGQRTMDENPNFSRLVAWLQRLGSWVVRKASGTDVPDATSGFRAISREAARQLHVFNEYTYTLETIIQAGHKGIAVTSVSVRTNPPVRPSRLYSGVLTYVRRQGLAILRIFMTYRPFQFFAVPGAVVFLAGFFISARFVVFYLMGEGSGHVQSLLLSTLLMGVGLFLGVTGLVADLMAVNRKLMEKIESRMWKLKDSNGSVK